ncbi:MAG: amidohydrolase family protein [Ilumatobacteraceae bacterium]
MTYAGDRRIFDTDSHVIELDDFLHTAATDEEAGLLPAMADQTELPVVAEGMESARRHFARRQTDPEVMVKFEAGLLDARRNGWSRLGAFDAAERSHAMDLFGFDYQLVLPTFAFHQVAHVDDHDVLEVGARVLNRAMARFCADDDRLFAIGYVPFSLGPERAGALLDQAFAAGCYSVMVDTNEPDPAARSFTHPDFDPVWARFADADVPFVAHVAVNGHYDAVTPSFHNNGRHVASLGGDAPTSPVGFVTLKNSVELFLGAMVLDEVFERHERLRCISMEHGAYWVPSWLQGLDFAEHSLARVSPRQRRASDVARERIRFAPFAGEPVGWIIDSIGPDMLVFASDYPHPEGTSDPIAKFEATMTGCDEATMAAFYFDNLSAFTGIGSTASS